MAEWRDELGARCDAAQLEPAMRELVFREVDEHLTDRFDDLVRGGASPAEAGRAVLADVPTGAALRALAESRRRPPARMPVVAPPARTPLADVGRDLRYALRVFARDRTFTAAAVATLALCIAANVAVFTIVNGVLLEAVDVPEPEALVQLGNAYPGAGSAAAYGGNSGVPDYFDRLTAVPALPEQALFRVRGVSVGDTGAERLIAMTTTPSLLRMVRASAALGRTFSDDDATLGKETKVVLSDGLWRRRFGRAPDVVGKTLMIGGVPHDIIGVMPPGFRFYDDEIALWTPAAFTAEERGDGSRHSNNWTHVGRIGPGATLEQAQAQVDALNAANLDRFPDMKQALIDARFHTRIDRLRDVLVADVRRPLYLLWGGVGCVLLIGLVNLTALTLARATARRSEIATRVALGAEPRRVGQQLVTEHLALAAVGGVAGVALGAFVLRALPQLGIELAPAGRALALTPLVWTYAVAIIVLVGVVLGLTAARASRRADTAAALREEGRGRTSSRAARRLRQALVVGQVALACMLLVGATVLLSSFRKLLAVDPGFRTSVVSGAIALPRAVYTTDPARVTFVQRLLEAVRATPGVVAAGVTTGIPFGDSRSDSVVWPADEPRTPGVSLVSPDQITVSSGYFEAMGMPMVAGRAFLDSDDANHELVVIVDQRLAERFWPGRDAVGRQIVQPLGLDAVKALAPGNHRLLRVVGVVREVKQHALVTPADLVGTYYFAAAQDAPASVVVAVQTANPSPSIEADLRRVVAGLDPRLPLFDVKNMQQRIDGSLSARRATMAMALGFGGLALVLSAVGLYGVLAYLVAQRTREIGIRMALGGSAPAIAGLVLRESAVVVTVGIGVGIAGAAWMGRALSSQLFEVRALEPMALAASIALLTAAAALASAAPLRRALRVDPAVTLVAE